MKLNVHFVGRLATEPEQRVTASGKEVASCRVCVHEDKGKDTFLQVSAFGSLAAFLAGHFRKGDGIEVSGSISWSLYEGKKGAGVNVVVFANSLDFIPSSRRSDERPVDLMQGESAVGDAEEVFAGGKTMEEIKASWDTLTTDDIPF